MPNHAFHLLRAALLLCLSNAAGAAVFTVTNTSDSGAGSLRQALTDAAASPAGDRIEFNIPGGGQRVITLPDSASALPALNSDTLDGTTQPGTAGTPLIVLAHSSTAALSATGSNCVIKGMEFRTAALNAGGLPEPATKTGVVLGGGGGHAVSACHFFGHCIGIRAVSPGNSIGAGTGALNTFRCSNGIVIQGTEAQPAGGNVIKGNTFGTEAVTGTPFLVPPLSAIQIKSFTPGTQIVSDQATGAVNTFNGLFGSVLEAVRSAGLVFRANRIGDTARVRDQMSNGAAINIYDCDGALIEENSVLKFGWGALTIESPNTTVRNNTFDNTGGRDTGAVIRVQGSGNMNNDIGGNLIQSVVSSDGIIIGNSYASTAGTPGPSGVRVHGNTIGYPQLYAPGLTGGAVHRMWMSGITVIGPVSNLEIGGEANTATGHLGPNTLSAKVAGIAMLNDNNNAGPQNIRFDRNRFASFSDAGVFDANKSIMLCPGANLINWNITPYTPPANDPLDADTGCNGLQNRPEITAVTGSGIAGILDSAANADFTIQCYALAPGAGVPEMLGSVTVTTDASGHAAFAVPLATPTASGSQVTAVATSAAGSTSHLSAGFVTVPPVISIVPVAPEVQTPEGGSALLTLNRTGELSGTTVVQLLGQPYVEAAWPLGAANEQDYTLPSSVTFLPGEASKVVPIAITEETRAEPRERFQVLLGDITGGVKHTEQTSAVFSITTSDPYSVTLGAPLPFPAEGNGGDLPQVLVPVSLDREVLEDEEIPVVFSASGGTATYPDDYIMNGGGGTGTAWFGSPGAVSRRNSTLLVFILGDDETEADETFELFLAPGQQDWPDGSPRIVMTPGALGTITIRDDDPIPAQIVPVEQTVIEGDSVTAGQAQLTIQLLRAPFSEVTVHWQTAAGTALAGADFTAASGDTVFAAGETSKTITVAITGDTIVDRWPAEAESFSVSISPGSTNVAIAGGLGVAAISIQDDDSREIVVADASVTEGNAGTQLLTFTATLSAVTGSPVSFDWSTADDSAAAGTDYTGGGGTLSIPAGATSATFTVAVSGDALYEFDESFTILLTNGLNGTPSRASVTGSIANDDTAPSLIIENTTVTVGNDDVDFYAWFRVRASAVSGAPITFQWLTQNDTALAGEHFTAGMGSLIIPAGTRTRWIAIPVSGGAADGGPKNFKVLIPSALGARVTAGGISATGNIVRAAITEFTLDGPRRYVMKFPTGLGQSYVIEESQVLDAENWIPITGLIGGSGAVIGQFVFSDTPNAFFRVRVVAVPPSN